MCRKGLNLAVLWRRLCIMLQCAASGFDSLLCTCVCVSGCCVWVPCSSSRAAAAGAPPLAERHPAPDQDDEPQEAEAPTLAHVQGPPRGQQLPVRPR